VRVHAGRDRQQRERLDEGTPRLMLSMLVGSFSSDAIAIFPG